MCDPHPMRTALLFTVVIVIGAALGIGLKQASDEDGKDAPTALMPSADEVEARLDGSPAPLAALHAQANVLLPGGRRALRARLAALEGHPVVVNVWASWCGPCRQEMPVFQRVALDRGREVAFLGVNLKDNRPAAKRFLADVPLSFPSYEDPDGRIFASYKVAGVPSTVFYDALGRQAYVHQGPYLNEKDLRTDIDRYALGKSVEQVS